jgi:hypothetical protein
MKEASIKPHLFEQPQHFALKEKAFDYFYAETKDVEEATKMANIVFNVKVLKSSYSAGILTKVEKFLHSVSE